MQKEISALEDEHVALLTRYEKTFDLTTIKEAAAAAGMAKPSASAGLLHRPVEPDSVVVYQQKSQNVCRGCSRRLATAYAQWWNISNERSYT